MPHVPEGWFYSRSLNAFNMRREAALPVCETDCLEFIVKRRLTLALAPAGHVETNSRNQNRALDNVLHVRLDVF